MLKASIVICTYNKLPRLKLTLFSIDKQIIDKKIFEVIVVDDGSDDGTSKFLTECDYSFQLRHVKIKNSGRAIARNVGIEMARNEIIIFIDDDMILKSDFVKEHIASQNRKMMVTHGRIKEYPYTKFFYDPVVGKLFDGLEYPCSLNNLLSCCLSYEEIETECSNLNKKSKYSSHEKIVRKVFENKVLNWFWIGFCGGNVSLPKSWIEQVEGFDENFSKKWGCEDLEMGYRLMKKGFPFSYCDRALNFHIDHYRENYIEEHGFNMHYFIEKYKDKEIELFDKFVQKKISEKQLLIYLDNCKEISNGY